MWLKVELRKDTTRHCRKHCSMENFFPRSRQRTGAFCSLSLSLSLCSVPNRRCKVAISLFATRLWFLSDVFVGCNFFLWLLDQNSDVLQVVISFFGCLIRILMRKQVVIFSFFVQDQSSDIYLHVTFLSVDLCFAFAAEVLQFYGSGFCCICRQMRRLNIQ